MNDPLALLILNRTTGRYAPDPTVVVYFFILHTCTVFPMEKCAIIAQLPTFLVNQSEAHTVKSDESPVIIPHNPPLPQ